MNLNQVTLAVPDVVRAIPFYQKLGLTLIVHTHDDYARFECPDGESTFSIHTGEGGGGAITYFEVDDVDLEFHRLQKQGIRFEHPPTDQRWLWREARLADPGGNQLIIYSAGENRKNPPWRQKGV